MSYEGNRVADRNRAARGWSAEGEVLAKPDEPIRDRISGRLRRNNIRDAQQLGRPIMNWARGNEWANNYNFAMRVRTGTINDYAAMGLSKLQFYRPKTYRYQEEQKAIEGWRCVRLPCTISRRSCRTGQSAQGLFDT